MTLKTNEITRKKSDFLEGTYVVHGIEEVMDKNDIVFVIDPMEEEIEKFQEVLVKGVGLKVIAIADWDTSFTIIRIPYFRGNESLCNFTRRLEPVDRNRSGNRNRPG